MNKKKLICALSLVGMMLVACQKPGSSESDTGPTSNPPASTPSTNPGTEIPEATFNGNLGETKLFSYANVITTSMYKATGRTGEIFIGEGEGGAELGFEQYYGYKQQTSSSTCSLYSDVMECQYKDVTEKRKDPMDLSSETYEETVKSVNQVHLEERTEGTFYIGVTDDGDVDENGNRVYATPGNYREVFQLNSNYNGYTIAQLSSAVGLFGMNSDLYKELSKDWYTNSFHQSSIWTGEASELHQWYVGNKDAATGDTTIEFHEVSGVDAMNTGELHYGFIIDSQFKVKKFSFELIINFGAAVFFTQKLEFNFEYKSNLTDFDRTKLLDYNLYKDIGYIEPDISDYQTTEKLQKIEGADGEYPYANCTSLDSEAATLMAQFSELYTATGAKEPTRRYEEYQQVDEEMQASEQRTLNWTRYEDDVVSGTYTSTGTNPIDHDYSNSYYYQRKPLEGGKVEEAYKHMSNIDASYKSESRLAGNNILDTEFLATFVGAYTNATKEESELEYVLTAWSRPAEEINNSTGEKAGEIKVILLQVIAQQTSGDYGQLGEFEVGYSIVKDDQNQDMLQIAYTSFFMGNYQDWERKSAEANNTIYGYRSMGNSQDDKNYKPFDASSFENKWISDWEFYSMFFPLFGNPMDDAKIPAAKNGCIEAFEFATVKADEQNGLLMVYFLALASGETVADYGSVLAADTRFEEVTYYAGETETQDVNVATEVMATFQTNQYIVLIDAVADDWNGDKVVEADELVITLIIALPL